MIEVCDTIAGECYDVSTVLLAAGLVLYGMTVACIAAGRKLVELAWDTP